MIIGYAVLIDDGTELGQVLNLYGEVAFDKDEAEELARAIGPNAHVEPLGEWVDPGKYS